MLSDRELIEHWDLRDKATRLTLTIAGLIVWAAILAAIALCGARWMWTPAGIVMAIALGCGWKLIRVWRRIEELDQFIA